MISSVKDGSRNAGGLGRPVLSPERNESSFNLLQITNQKNVTGTQQKGSVTPLDKFQFDKL